MIDSQTHSAALKELALGRARTCNPVIRRFALIDSPTQPVIIPWGAAGETVCHRLRRLNLRGRPGLLRRLASKAQRYSVNVYPQELETLLAAGTIETAHERFLILADPQLYSPRLGLLRQDAGGGVPYEIGWCSLNRARLTKPKPVLNGTDSAATEPQVKHARKQVAYVEASFPLAGRKARR